jgi:hypothetical protein
VGKVKLESAKNFFFLTLGIDLVAVGMSATASLWAVRTARGIASGAVVADQTLTASIDLYDSMFWLLLLTTTGVGIGVVKWLKASYQYAGEVIGATEFKNKKWIWLAWTTPLAFFRPYLSVNEIFKSSGPNYMHPDGWKKESWSGYLLAWWVLYVVTHLAWLVVNKHFWNWENGNVSNERAIELTEMRFWVLVSSEAITLLWFVVAGSLTRRMLNRSKLGTSAPMAGSLPSERPSTSQSTTPSHKTANFEQTPSPVIARATTQSIPKPRVTTSDEEAIYEQALNELDTNKKPGLWAMALAQTANGGNPDGTYIALRVEQLLAEHTAQKSGP